MAYLIVIAGLEEYLAFKVGLLSGRFYEVLGNKDQESFKSHIFYCLVVIGLRDRSQPEQISGLSVANVVVERWTTDPGDPGLSPARS